MLRLFLITLLVFSLLSTLGGAAVASSDQAADRACVGQFSAEAVQVDDLRPHGLTVISPAAHESGFGNVQSNAAVHCTVDLLAKRYSI